jgi:hypothetical protein
MPRQKDLKRLVRTRMQKTGESYTGARSQLLRRKSPPAAVPLPSNYLELAGMSDDAVRTKTGRDWPGWVALLDREGATSLPHREIVDRVHAHGVPDWWSQTVTVGYERIRGLRDVGQRRGGGYEVSKSRTVAAPLGRLYRAFHAPATRARWLPGVKLVIRTATGNRSMRVTWPDGTSVHVMFYAKGEAKSQVAIQHVRLASKADAEKLRAFWTERLASLAELVEKR